MPKELIWKKLWSIRDPLAVASLLAVNGFFYWPFWNFSFNANTFSAPLIPLLVKLGEFIFSWPHQLAINRVLLAFVIAGPLAWFGCFRYLTPRGWIAFVASLAASLPIGWWGASRINATYIWGDGAHVAALSLTPVVCWSLLAFLRRGAFSQGIIAALALTVVALTSPFGLFATLIFSQIVLFSEMLLGRARLKLARALFVIIISLGFSAFWYHPRFLHLVITSSQGQELLSTLGSLLPISFFILPVSATFGFLLFEKQRHLQPLFIATFLTVTFFSISFARNLSHAGFSQPSRYFPELGYSSAFLLAAFGAKLLQRFRYSAWLKHKLNLAPLAQATIRWTALGLVFGVGLVLSRRGALHLWQLVNQPSALDWWASTEKADIWKLRDSGPWEAAGYLITFIVVAAVSFLWWQTQSGTRTYSPPVSSPDSATVAPAHPKQK